MKVLLDRDAHGCTVFFTTNSPCVEFCSTPDICTSIIPGLEIFKNHNGPKAFVFRQVSSRALGFVLLFLLPLALGNEIGNLKEIINKLHEISGIEGDNQYAMAINVPARYCNGGAELDQNFLSQDSAQN
ncbi:uncharacterized protein DAT39_011704, partial [Clarias magur]